MILLLNIYYIQICSRCRSKYKYFYSQESSIYHLYLQIILKVASLCVIDFRSTADVHISSCGDTEMVKLSRLWTNIIDSNSTEQKYHLNRLDKLFLFICISFVGVCATALVCISENRFVKLVLFWDLMCILGIKIKLQDLQGKFFYLLSHLTITRSFKV